MHALKWDLLCSSKDKGGLGIGSVLDKNKGLLAKWVWRFGKEESSLWKSIICAKYRVPLYALRWDWNGGPSSSFFIKAVYGLFEQNSKVAKVMEDGLLGWWVGAIELGFGKI